MTKKKHRECEVGLYSAVETCPASCLLISYLLSLVSPEAGLESRLWLHQPTQVHPHTRSGRGPVHHLGQRRFPPLQLQQHICNPRALRPAPCPVVSTRVGRLTHLNIPPIYLHRGITLRLQLATSCVACLHSASSSQVPVNTVSCVLVFSWASKDVVWSNMLEKDKTYTRDVHMMEKHPHLLPKMRAILLDWLMEVCSSLFLTNLKL